MNLLNDDFIWMNLPNDELTTQRIYNMNLPMINLTDMDHIY